MLIKDAAPFVAAKPISPKNLSRRVKNSVTTEVGRKRWMFRGINPDTVKYGVNDEWTFDMAEILGLSWKCDPGPSPVDEKTKGQVLKDGTTFAPKKDFPNEGIKNGVSSYFLKAREEGGEHFAIKGKEQDQKNNGVCMTAKQDKVENTPVSDAVTKDLIPLIYFLVAVAPLAEAYSFSEIGKQAYPDLGPIQVAGWAFIGYNVGLVAFVNYVRIEDHNKAELWAGLFALVQLATHGAATGWKIGPLLAATLCVMASWAINSAYKKK